MKPLLDSVVCQGKVFDNAVFRLRLALVEQGAQISAISAACCSACNGNAYCCTIVQVRRRSSLAAIVALRGAHRQRGRPIIHYLAQTILDPEVLEALIGGHLSTLSLRASSVPGVLSLAVSVVCCSSFDRA